MSVFIFSVGRIRIWQCSNLSSAARTADVSTTISFVNVMRALQIFPNQLVDACKFGLLGFYTLPIVQYSKEH
jgi:hypothetical protein